MIKWFKGKSQPPSPRPSRAADPSVDGDETIVIQLTDDRTPPPPDEIRLEFEPAAAEKPTPASAVTRARAAQPGEDTEVLRIGDLQSPSAARATARPEQEANTSAWLVVVAGPHRGRCFRIRLGRNTIGRDTGNTVALDVDDDAISKDGHVTVAADPKTRKFFVVPGNSTNLAYVNDQPLLEAREIGDGAKIQLGATMLAFVQFYGKYVDWS